MSLVAPIPLTEEQEKFLQDLEEEFKDRYTEKDEEFKAVFEAEPIDPPIIENWVDPRPRNNYRDKNFRHRNCYRNSPYEKRDRHNSSYRHRGRHWQNEDSYSSHQNYRHNRFNYHELSRHHYG